MNAKLKSISSEMSYCLRWSSLRNTRNGNLIEFSVNATTRIRWKTANCRLWLKELSRLVSAFKEPWMSQQSWLDFQQLILVLSMISEQPFKVQVTLSHLLRDYLVYLHQNLLLQPTCWYFKKWYLIYPIQMHSDYYDSELLGKKSSTSHWSHRLFKLFSSHQLSKYLARAKYF